MNVSLKWLSSLVEGPTPSAEACEQALIKAGFPVESRTPLPDGDVCLDVEVTSNRGDCLSHIGLARELAANLGLRLKHQHVRPQFSGPPTSPDVTLESSVGSECPRFTARMIRGVTVGPSPAWMRERLEAVGQRSISNVVDATNYIALELGNPCHVFDHARLAGGKLVVRHARDGEPLTTLDGKARTLRPDEVVVADASRAQSLAGVIGGQDSEVTSATRDVVFEMATWDPVAVRRAARRHQVRTDASHRFERLVDARTVDAAAERAAALIAEISGGVAATTALEVGGKVPALSQVSLRPARVSAILGVDLPVDEIVALLLRLEIAVQPLGRGGETLLATVPAWRPDLTREIDLIEEVARVKGLDAVPRRPHVSVAVRAPQASETGRRAAGELLAGLGFFETVTFSFTTPEQAALFAPAARVISIDDSRRGGEPALRPSVLAGLLACRRKNARGLVQQEGGIRLFEIASSFAARSPEATHAPLVAGVEERLNIALVLDVPMKDPRGASHAEVQDGLRLMRGAIESLCEALAGAGTLRVLPTPAPIPAFQAGAHARLELSGAALGSFGVVSETAQKQFELPGPVVMAELDLSALLAHYPPRRTVAALPQFPGTERDLSVIVPEAVSWASIHESVRRHAAANIESVDFVTTYRGKPIPEGRKSVTLRLRFREATRTMRHEDADAPTAAITEALKKELGAELRA